MSDATALTADGWGDYAYPSAANSTIITSGSVSGAEAAASYQDDTLTMTGTTTDTIIASGHHASPSLLGGSVLVMGAVTTTVVSATTNYAVTPQDSIVLMTVTSKTVTLPPAAVAGRGRLITVKNAPGVNSTAVQAGDGGPIDGNNPPLTVSVVNRFLSDGSAWHVV